MVEQQYDRGYSKHSGTRHCRQKRHGPDHRQGRKCLSFCYRHRRPDGKPHHDHAGDGDTYVNRRDGSTDRGGVGSERTAGGWRRGGLANQRGDRGHREQQWTGHRRHERYCSDNGHSGKRLGEGRGPGDAVSGAAS